MKQAVITVRLSPELKKSLTARLADTELDISKALRAAILAISQMSDGELERFYFKYGLMPKYKKFLEGDK